MKMIALLDNKSLSHNLLHVISLLFHYVCFSAFQSIKTNDSQWTWLSLPSLFLASFSKANPALLVSREIKWKIQLLQKKKKQFFNFLLKKSCLRKINKKCIVIQFSHCPSFTDGPVLIHIQHLMASRSNTRGLPVSVNPTKQV